MIEATNLDFKKNDYGEEKARLICPKCGMKTNVKVFRDTLIVNFPLYCYKCNKPFTIGYSGGVEKLT